MQKNFHNMPKWTPHDSSNRTFDICGFLLMSFKSSITQTLKSFFYYNHCGFSKSNLTERYSVTKFNFNQGRLSPNANDAFPFLPLSLSFDGGVLSLSQIGRKMRPLPF
jgi:hypothetical protein